MIQRVQSLFLLGVVICLAVFLFLPIWVKTGTATNEMLELKAFSLSTPQGLLTTPYLGIGIAAIISMIVALIELFQFKSRLNQMKLGALNSLIMALTLGATVYLIVTADQLITGPKGDFEPGFYLPIVAMILNIVANRFIRRDELLVRSVDRLR